MTLPNKHNFCGGAFPDWLEVNLLKQCNAKCSWCIEKIGYHPEKVVDWLEICKKAIQTDKKNIILLGGEPTLHKQLKNIVHTLSAEDRNVYITTNGSKLTPDFVESNLNGIKGANISIHDYDINNNYRITGLILNLYNLKDAINKLHKMDVSVRFNCNCIKDYVCSEDTVKRYIQFAQNMGADEVRFAELKQDENNFINLAKIFNYQYGLNDDPFIEGCNLNTTINNMPVNFRQMCGLQTKCRPKPINPEQAKKQVLYYNGIIYDGWQTIKEAPVTDKELMDLLMDVADAKITPNDAKNKIKKALEDKEKENNDTDSGGCRY